MRTTERLFVAAVLILLTSCSAQRSPSQALAADFHEGMLNGRIGFKLWIPETTWKHMTQPSPDLTSVLLD
jgi:hypothetical protein